MVTYNRRPRSLWGNLSSALLQPVVFYRAFPATRQWMWVAVMILLLNGFSAVNQPTPGGASADPSSEVLQPIIPDSRGVQPGIEGGFVPPPDLGAPTETSSAPNVSKIVMTALLAAGGVVLAWFIQAIILSEVSLINGVRPSFGRNLQIAVWATVPLGMMLLIQQIYFAAGGEAGQVGLSLLLEHWSGFATLPAFSRAVLTTLATNITLFWLWSLILLYLGGRYVLNGKRTAVVLVVVVWVIISVLVPAFTSPIMTGEEIGVPDDSGILIPGEPEQIMPMETQELGDSEQSSSRSTGEAGDSEGVSPEDKPTASESSDDTSSEAPVPPRSTGG